MLAHAQALAQRNITVTFVPQRVLLDLVPGDALVFTHLQPWNPKWWHPRPAGALHLQAIRVPPRFEVPQQIIDAGGAVLELNTSTAEGIDSWFADVTALGAQVAHNAQSLHAGAAATAATNDAVAEVRGWHADADADGVHCSHSSGTTCTHASGTTTCTALHSQIGSRAEELKGCALATVLLAACCCFQALNLYTRDIS